MSLADVGAYQSRGLLDNIIGRWKDTITGTLAPLLRLAWLDERPRVARQLITCHTRTRCTCLFATAERE
jgi:hypothetical protein